MEQLHEELQQQLGESQPGGTAFSIGDGGATVDSDGPSSGRSTRRRRKSGAGRRSRRGSASGRHKNLRGYLSSQKRHSRPEVPAEELARLGLADGDNKDGATGGTQAKPEPFIPAYMRSSAPESPAQRLRTALGSSKRRPPTSGQEPRRHTQQQQQQQERQPHDPANHVRRPLSKKERSAIPRKYLAQAQAIATRPLEVALEAIRTLFHALDADRDVSGPLTWFIACRSQKNLFHPPTRSASRWMTCCALTLSKW